MAQAPKASRVTPRQHAADAANLAKARAAQRQSGALHHHTAKQQAASRQNLARARSAQKSRRGGRRSVSPKKAAAPAPDIRPRCDVSTEWVLPLYQLPACGPVALAAHLALFTGIVLPDEAVLGLHARAGITSLAGLLERAAAEGLAGPGTRLAYYEPCDPDDPAPGLLYGIQLPHGYHAVLAHPAGMLSWGAVLPRDGTPEEAWWLEWEAE
jgi:hypothetical protein